MSKKITTKDKIYSQWHNALWKAASKSRESGNKMGNPAISEEAVNAAPHINKKPMLIGYKYATENEKLKFRARMARKAMREVMSKKSLLEQLNYTKAPYTIIFYENETPGLHHPCVIRKINNCKDWKKNATT